MLKITGAAMLLIGMAAGIVLVTAPFGFPPGASASPAAWLLFPGAFIAGAVLLVLGGGESAIGGLWRLCAALLLTLTVGSASGLVLPLLGIAEPVGQTISLWYVLVLAGGGGTACALGPARTPDSQSART
jgi:hypothetical protein